MGWENFAAAGTHDAKFVLGRVPAFLSCGSGRRDGRFVRLRPECGQERSAANGATKLPSGAIIVIAKDAEAIDKPDAIYLSPEKFKELNDQIEALKKQVAAEKALPPSSCELSGGLEKRGTQTVVKLKAAFKFRTLTPRSSCFSVARSAAG